MKGDMNGLIGGNRSPPVLKMPASFILYVPEGRAAGEYQLLRLHVNADSREFRAATGGVVHESGGALRDVIDYTAKENRAPRLSDRSRRRCRAKANSAFCPLQMPVGNNIPSSGKIYSFTLVH